VPDITFYLDIEPEEAAARKFSQPSLPLAFESDELDRMERSGVAFYHKVRQGYLDIISRNKERFISIDALLPEMVIHRQIMAMLAKRFPA